MQTLQTWLLPGHYSIYTRKTRRINKRAFAIAAVVAIAAFGLAVSLRSLRTSESIATSNQAVSLNEVIKTLEYSQNDPQTPQASASYGILQQKVQDWVKAHPGAQWGVVVQDLENPDNKVSVNGGAQFDAASLYKLFLTIPLAKQLPFSAWQNTKTLNGQGEHTFAQCVDVMLARSDNPCGEAVGDYLGWAKATQAVRLEGFSGTVLSNAPIRSTANDAAEYLTRLARGDWFDEQTRTFIMTSLAHQKFRDGIPSGCHGCTVFNKTGQLEHATNDAAIIYKGNTHYVLSILSRNGTFQQISDLTNLVNSQLP